jgi:chromosome segregation ATPase
VESADVEANKARPLLEAALAAEDAATTQLQLVEAEAGAAESMHTLGDQLDEACNEARGQVLDLERELQAAKAQQEELKEILEQNELALDGASKQDRMASFDLMTRSNSVTAAQKQKALDTLAAETAKLAATKAQLAAASQRVASLVGALQKQTLKAEEIADELRRELERYTTEMRLLRARMLQAREARTQAEDDRRAAERAATLAASHVKEAISELFSAVSALGDLLAKCSPSVAQEAEAKRQLLANTALKSSLHAGDGAALAAAAQTYLPYCSREVALVVQQTLGAVGAVEKMLQAALLSDHVPGLEQALQYADPKWNPSGVAACKARLEARLWEARLDDGEVRLQSDPPG